MQVERDEFVRAVDALSRDVRDGFHALNTRSDAVSAQIAEMSTESSVIAHRVNTVERLVYGLVSIVLTTVVLAILAQVMR